MNAWYATVAARARHRCEYCHAPEAIFNFHFEVEHVVPPGRGGADTDDNLALACRSCNVFKADCVDARDLESNETIPLFNPRRHEWDEHFTVDAATGTINGLTPGGRATVSLLRMNTPAQTAARLQWMRLELFP